MTKRTFLLLLILISLLAILWYSQISNVTSTPIIEDKAAIFTEKDEQDLTSYHGMLLDKFDIDYHVITLNQAVDIDRYAAEQFASRKIGLNSQTNRGLLLVINTAQDQIRMEVSGNLESVFTDAFISYIERRQMVPFFNENRIGDGVFATGEVIHLRAIEAQEGTEFDETTFFGSIGGGAKSKAGIGEGRQELRDEQAPDVFAADTVEESLARFFKAYRQHNDRRDLDVITPESREFMSDMVVTMAQMDNVTKRYQHCEKDKVVFSDDGMRAVWLFTLADRACDPFLFEKGDDNKWRIDLKTAGIGLGHTYGNIWYVHYDRLEESGFWKYQFGFRDFYFYRPKGEQFDHQGIPYYHRWGMQIGYVREGSLITRTVKGSYVEKIGLREGDMILSWEGKTSPSPSYLGWRMDRVREGLDVEIIYCRDKTIHHTIVKAPPRAKAGKLRWGMEVSRQGPKNYPVVNYITPGSQSDEMGLNKDDYIIVWQDKQPASIRDINKSIRLAKPGDIVTATISRAGESVDLIHTAKARREMGEVR